MTRGKIYMSFFKCPRLRNYGITHNYQFKFNKYLSESDYKKEDIINERSVQYWIL